MSLIEEVYDSLRVELEITDGSRFNSDLLMSKVENAYREVKTARKYPISYTEEVKETDMNNYFSQIRAIALYDYSKIGSEGQTQFSEDGASIHYVDRDKLFQGVLPIAARG